MLKFKFSLAALLALVVFAALVIGVFAFYYRKGASLGVASTLTALTVVAVTLFLVGPNLLAAILSRRR
jgi:hypothetical protein